MIPEAVVAMLACARFGVLHSVVFAGFTATALGARIADAAGQAADHRRWTVPPRQARAVEGSGRPSGRPTPTRSNTSWWSGAPAATCPGPRAATCGGTTSSTRRRRTHHAEAFDAEHPLFLLYTSGTTGKPKGIVHTSGGYLTQASYTHHNIFDIKPETDVFWCTADIGWVTGHTYSVYGPLSNGATQIIYEGTPDSPDQHRHFQIIEKYGVTIYYTAPTMIRTFMKWGREIPDAHDLSSLRLLGTVGEPINPEAWRWYRKVIGRDSIPIVDTWWQTETGSAMISPLPGVAAAKPGSAMTPLPGVSAKIVDDDGNQLSLPSSDEGEHTSGYLVLDQPWPSMLRGIWGDDDRFRETYWSKFAEQGWYFAGDGARYDSDGAIWILGRIDDVMNVSGHRISTAEVESALVGHSGVAEAAVVGATDETTGQAICAFVVLEADHAQTTGAEIIDELRAEVARVISPIARPRELHVVPELPKTRSGKIMRRLLRDIAEKRELGDTSTLLDPGVFDAIRAAAP